jgi:hypothetical protein
MGWAVEHSCGHVTNLIDMLTAMSDNNSEALRGRNLNRKAVVGVSVLAASRITGPRVLAGIRETPCFAVNNNSTPSYLTRCGGVRLYRV